MKKIKKIIHILWYEFVRTTLRLTLYPLFLLTSEGVKNVPRKGPVLLLSSHQSFLDPFLVQMPINKHLHYVAKSTLFDNAFSNMILPTLNTIPIRRGEADLVAMRKIIAMLKEDKIVCLFPEGTRTPDGRLTEIKGGFSLLSRRSQAVVVPVVIEGAFECWSRERKFPKLGRIYLKFGKGFTPDEIKELGDEAFSKAFNERLQKIQNEVRIKRGVEPFDYGRKQ
jgi:1-acyl-sn-glycerol-3-phosphate acyltransferase